jgi:hypothetical protein
MTRYLVELIGSVKLVEPTVRDIDFALGRLAERFSTRSVRLARMILIQAIQLPRSMTSGAECCGPGRRARRSAGAAVEVARSGSGRGY